MKKIWTINNIEAFNGKFCTGEELHKLVDGTVLNASSNSNNTVVKNDSGIFVFDTGIYTQAKDGIGHLSAKTTEFEDNAAPANIGVAHELLATNVGIYDESADRIIDKGVVIGAMSKETDWDSMDEVLNRRILMIKYLKDIKSQITQLLDAGYTHEGIFRMMNGKPYFGIVQNLHQARILNMHDGWVLPMDNRTNRRRTQDTWACLVNLMNYYCELNGKDPLYDPTKYMDSSVVDKLIDDFGRKTR